MLGCQKLGDLGENLTFRSRSVVKSRSVYYCDATLFLVVKKNLDSLALRCFCKSVSLAYSE